ncbi:MAG: glycosyltransferase family 2 protein [Acidobacteria bacterium]|nr:glycosyltransferase family 2 protein [Acidobacteriota bacterium]
MVFAPPACSVPKHPTDCKRELFPPVRTLTQGNSYRTTLPNLPAESRRARGCYTPGSENGLSGSLSVVIPAYNEELRLPRTLERVWNYLQQRAAAGEVVVVNDGSRDGTAEAARAFAASHAGSRIPVRVLENPGNRGKGYSVRHGMLETQGDWALFSDADLSSPIEEHEKLQAAADAGGYDIAIGSRALDRSLIGLHQSVFRENAGRVFNGLMRLTTGLPFHDTQCGFKLFRRPAAREIFCRQRLERFGFDVEVLYLARKLGFRTVEVPVRWDHSEGTKVSMLGDSLDMFWDLWRVRRNDWRGLYDGKGEGPDAPVGPAGSKP